MRLRRRPAACAGTAGDASSEAHDGPPPPEDEQARASTQELLEFFRLLLRPVLVLGLAVFVLTGVILLIR